MEVDTNSSLENLQTDDQRRVLDTVAQVRKCGLEGILSLPQLVVCGDQSWSLVRRNLRAGLMHSHVWRNLRAGLMFVT